jgi:hypothetical protein
MKKNSFDAHKLLISKLIEELQMEGEDYIQEIPKEAEVNFEKVSNTENHDRRHFM